MTETEFDILDELYFVTSFSELQNALQIPETELCLGLEKLVEKGYVKCFFPDPDSEIAFSRSEFTNNCQSYYFLATKAGLLAHNSR